LVEFQLTLDFVELLCGKNDDFGIKKEVGWFIVRNKVLHDLLHCFIWEFIIL
jgi:hypothetical protein